MKNKGDGLPKGSPLISIVVPVYKVAEYLERCVQSICEQTYENIEIILVDDGSPDQCPIMCDKLAKEDKRIRVIHKENGGLSSARNAGIQISTGEWLMFIDSDDFIAVDMVQKLYEATQMHHAKVAFCGVTAFIEDADGYREMEFWGTPPTAVREGHDILKEAVECKQGVLGGHYVVAWNKIYHKSIFEHLRYPEGQLHEDEAIAHHILGACGRIASISESLYYYRQRSDSIIGVKKNPLRTQSIALAYGDRILFYNEKGYSGLEVPLYEAYWKMLIGNYCSFKQDTRCVRLRKKLLIQMGQVEKLYKKRPQISGIRKFGTAAFCRFPGLVSKLFVWSVRLRSANTSGG